MEEYKSTNEEEIIEPDKVDSVGYKCPSCGASMVYDPTSESLSCAYCSNKINLKGESSNVENDFLEGIKEDERWDNETIIFHCESCGANNVKERTDLSSKCPFCGSNSVVETKELPGIRPQRVIPFRISKEKALEQFRKQLKKSFFAPSDLKKNFTPDKLNGTYLPAWTFDTNAFAKYEGRLGKYYTVTVGSGKNRHTETRIRWFSIRGTKQFMFDDILVVAGKKISQEQMSRVLPFETNNSYVYQKEYLSGFTAEHYQINLESGWNVAKQKAVKQMERLIANDYSHDVIDYIRVAPVYSNIKYKYVLLPVWISFYRYQNKEYYFLVNGESGRIGGKTPVSFVKVTSLVLIILLIIAIVAICIIVFGEKPTGNFTEISTMVKFLKSINK